MDNRSPEQRKKNMQAVKSKNTAPELVVRRALFALGYRYRLHRRDLPGSPDIVFPERKKVVFVNGCFWHGHNCPRGRAPKSRKEFWYNKLEANRTRDACNIKELKKLGWRSFTVWQCQTTDLKKLLPVLVDFLGTPRKNT